MPSRMGVLYMFIKVILLGGAYQSHYYKILIISKQVCVDILIYYIVFE